METKGEIKMSFDVASGSKNIKPFDLEDCVMPPTEYGTIKIAQVIKDKKFIITTEIVKVELEDGTLLSPTEWLQRMKELAENGKD